MKRKKKFKIGSLYRLHSKSKDHVIVWGDDPNEDNEATFDNGTIVLCIGASVSSSRYPLVLAPGFTGWVFPSEIKVIEVD